MKHRIAPVYLIRLIRQANIHLNVQLNMHMSKLSCGVATFMKKGGNHKLQNKTETRDIKLSFSFLSQLEAVGSSALSINERPEQCTNTRHQSCQPLRYHLGMALEQ